MVLAEHLIDHGGVLFENGGTDGLAGVFQYGVAGSSSGLPDAVDHIAGALHWGDAVLIAVNGPIRGRWARCSSDNQSLGAVETSKYISIGLMSRHQYPDGGRQIPVPCFLSRQISQ